MRDLIRGVTKGVTRGSVRSYLTWYERLLMMEEDLIVSGEFGQDPEVTGRYPLQGNVVELDGATGYLDVPHLVGTETVVSSYGTSTPTVSTGRIDFDAGWCAVLILSDGSQYNLNNVNGTVAFDSSGNGNHGTLMGGATFEYDNTLPHEADRANLDGHSRYPFLDGISDIADWGDDSAFDSTDSIDISMSVLLTSYPSGSALLVKGTTGTDGNYIIDFTGSAGTVRFFGYSGVSPKGLYTAGGISLTLNEVIDLRFTFDGTTWAIYVNGSLSRSTSDPCTLTTTTSSLRSGYRVAYAGGSIMALEVNGQEVDVNSGGIANHLIAPRDESDTIKDVLGNDLQFSGSVYPVVPVDEGAGVISYKSISATGTPVPATNSYDAGADNVAITTTNATLNALVPVNAIFRRDSDLTRAISFADSLTGTDLATALKYTD